MKKISKLFLGLIAALTVGAVTACGGAQLTPEEKVAEAHNSLIYAQEVTSDFDLITSYSDDLQGVTVSYTSSNENFIKISDDGTKALVTRPANGSTTYGYEVVVLTATISCENVSDTKDFGCQVLEAPKEGLTLNVIDNPVVGTAYKLGLVQENREEVLYINGEMSNYYFATTKKPSEAVDVTVEEANGGFYLAAATKEGKKYIEIKNSENGEHVNVVYSATATVVWKWDATLKTYITPIVNEVKGSGDYYLGTYSNYNTFSASHVDKASSSFVGHLCDVTGVSDPEEKPAEPSGYQMVTAPAVNTEYKLGMFQEADSEQLWFTGSMNSYYGASSADIAEGVVVKLEEATDGYYMSFTVSGAKKYINTGVNGTHLNFVIGDAAETVWSWNSEYNTLTGLAGEETVYIGTYGSFNTFGVSKLSYAATSYVSHLYTF